MLLGGRFFEFSDVENKFIFTKYEFGIGGIAGCEDVSAAWLRGHGGDIEVSCYGLGLDRCGGCG